MVAIGEASRKSGVSIETIRYYEREGIIGRAGRTEAGRRDYLRAEISELRFIKRCRDLGFPLEDAAALRDLSRETGSSCSTVEQVGRKHLACVRTRLAELTALEQALAELVHNCTQGSQACPMLATLTSGEV
jgi:MerR family mercuric resistance operon transcriptional regulator